MGLMKKLHQTHEMLGRNIDRPDGVYELDEFGFNSIVIKESKVVQTRAPGRTYNPNVILPHDVQEKLAEQLIKIAEIKQEQ